MSKVDAGNARHFSITVILLSLGLGTFFAEGAAAADPLDGAAHHIWTCVQFHLLFAGALGIALGAIVFLANFMLEGFPRECLLVTSQAGARNLVVAAPAVMVWGYARALAAYPGDPLGESPVWSSGSVVTFLASPTGLAGLIVAAIAIRLYADRTKKVARKAVGSETRLPNR